MRGGLAGGELERGSPPRSGDDHSLYLSLELSRAASYEFPRRVWDRAAPTKFRRDAEIRHDSAASSVIESNSFSISRTSGSSFAARQDSIKSLSRSESFSLRAFAKYPERSRAGTRRTNCKARSSGRVKVIFRVAIVPYYHIEAGKQLSLVCGSRNLQNRYKGKQEAGMNTRRLNTAVFAFFTTSLYGSLPRTEKPAKGAAAPPKIVLLVHYQFKFGRESARISPAG